MWLGDVGPDGVADDGGCGLDPTDTASEAMGLEPQERTHGQPDVIALGTGLSALAPLLITFGIRIRAVLTSTEVVCIGLYYLLYLPATYGTVKFLTSIGLALTA